jgi:hypothetical protein
MRAACPKRLSGSCNRFLLMRVPNAGRASTQDDTASLTQGQINTVRAAFKAGVKSSMVARQFGISQADIRKALASQARERKS